MCVKTISRDEYESLRTDKRAGLAENLKPRTVQAYQGHYPDWDGKYWAALDANYPAWVTCAPVNVEESPTLFD